jgi:hypothetical protein
MVHRQRRSVFRKGKRLGTDPAMGRPRYPDSVNYSIKLRDANGK